jgi:hypothetical protein
VGLKYTQARFLLEDDAEEKPLPEACPGWRRQREERVYGMGYLEREGWEGLDIADPLKPKPEEYVVVSGTQFDRILRHIGVVNLIYSGFHAYSSLLHASAGIREMKFRYGYRPVLLRECTIAEECPDILPERLMARAAFRFVELQCGYTAALSDFLAAARAVTNEEVQDV